MSPIGAYNAATDHVLVLDVAAQVSLHLGAAGTPLGRDASVDSASGKRRGYLIVQRGASDGHASRVGCRFRDSALPVLALHRLDARVTGGHGCLRPTISRHNVM